MPTKRERYRKNRADLRRLMQDFNGGDSRGVLIQGKFGYFYNNQYLFHQIVNTINNTVIATVKAVNGKLVVRYRPNSWYSDILSNPDKYATPLFPKVVTVPSTSLGRNREPALGNVGEAVRARERNTETGGTLHTYESLQRRMMETFYRSDAVWSETVYDTGTFAQEHATSARSIVGDTEGAERDDNVQQRA